MELTTILVLSLLFLLTVYILQSWSRQHGYQSLPPGPTPIPVLGTPKYMDMRYAANTFQQLSKKYGSIFTIWKMSEPVIVLCGYETVKDALINHAEQFSERPFIPVINLSTKGYGLRGPRWRSLRRFTLTSLRNFGMGKKVMERRILAESKYLIQAISETRGKSFKPRMLMASAVGNIISSVLFGEHFEYKDEKLQELLMSTYRNVRGTSSPLSTICNILPVLLKIPFVRHKAIKENTFLQTFVTEHIKYHKETFKPESPRDLIDYFLLKIKEVEHEIDPDFCDTSLLMVITGLLTAGTDTTASSLTFSLMVLAHYPDVQAKVQQEIDEVTKSLRLPEIMDKPQMAYTNAVFHEIQRVLDLAPIAVVHAVTEDVNFRGYTIPKGATVIPFLTSVLSDPSQWETPEEFNPGHFLNDEGQFRTRLAFMPFSADLDSVEGTHGLQPGDWVEIKRHVRKDLDPRFDGPFQVLLTTHTAVKVEENLTESTPHTVRRYRTLKMRILVLVVLALNIQALHVNLKSDWDDALIRHYQVLLRNMTDADNYKNCWICTHKTIPYLAIPASWSELEDMSCTDFVKNRRSTDKSLSFNCTAVPIPIAGWVEAPW